MTQIERREARIRRIRAQSLNEDKGLISYERVAANYGVHHCIGQSEASPEHIGLFVRNRGGDPSVKV